MSSRVPSSEFRIPNVVLGLALVSAIACVAEGSAQTSRTAERVVPDDTVSLARLIGSARGSTPLNCEMITRHVDQQGSWSRFGSMASDPLVTDSSSAALLTWIQNKHNDPVVVPRLRTALRDDDACVRRVASSFLARVDHPTALNALLGALDESNVETRAVAAVGLGMAEKPAAIDPLIGRLRDSSPTVRRSAAWALGALEAKKAVAPLMAMLTNDADPRVRQAAAWAIGNIK
jgi:HEAT repeat protein